MSISAADVKKLREKTGAGMLDCQKALKEADGNFDEAVTILKKMGLAAVAKRAERASEEGRIFAYIGTKTAGVLELGCETDFVARNEDFVKTGNDLVKKAVEGNLKASDAGLLAAVIDIAATIKENITLRRLDIIDLAANEVVETYLHGDAASIGVFVKFKVSSPEVAKNEAVKAFIHDSALHAAAFKPQFLKADLVPANYLASQEDIFSGQVAQDEKLKDKAEQVKQGAIKGKLQKHLKEICFSEQAFVKDDKKSVAQVAQEIGKAAGGSIELVDFKVYRAGEALN